MKRLLLFSMILITLSNASYAAFPVCDTLKGKQDILKTEEIKKYHDHLIKIGIDLNSCKCENCRNGITTLQNNREINKPLNQFKRTWRPIIITMVILALILGLLLVRYVDKNLSGGTPLG